MYAKVVVVELWYGFCEEIYCIIEHPFWCLERCSLRLWLMGIICNFWEPIRQTYGSIMHTRAMQVKTRQCLNPRRRPSATIRIESACGVATDWVTCGFLNPNQINNVNGAWRLMYSREVRIYRLVIAIRKMSNLLRRGWGESATGCCAGIQQP